MELERNQFMEIANRALVHIEDKLANLEHEDLDIHMSGDVLSIDFADGGRFVVNSHSAAGQIWLAAGTDAWHFDYRPEQSQWIAAKNGNELFKTVERVVGEKLKLEIRL